VSDSLKGAIPWTDIFRVTRIA